MAFVQRRLSDISGVELEDSEVVTVVLKGYGRVFDCKESEIASLKAIANAEELELRMPNGSTRTIMVTKTELNKLLPDDKIAGFDSSRGRRSGYSPSKLIKSAATNNGAE